MKKSKPKLFFWKLLLVFSFIFFTFSCNSNKNDNININILNSDLNKNKNSDSQFNNNINLINDDKQQKEVNQIINLTLEKRVSANKEAQRLKQSHSGTFSNTQVSGIYLDPQKIYNFKITINEKIEENSLSIFSLQSYYVDPVDKNESFKADFRSLAKNARWLKQGVNEITFDLTNNKYGTSLFFDNLTEKDISLKIENLSTFNRWKNMSFYQYKPNDLSSFLIYINSLKENYQQVPVTFLEFIDPLKGGIQIYVGSKQVKSLFIDHFQLDKKEEDAKYYLENYFTKTLFKWLDELGLYNGQTTDKNDFQNKLTTLPMFIIATENIKNPSPYFAWYQFIHLAPDFVDKFLENPMYLYHRLLNHEKGHLIDNQDIEISEQTNNLYVLYANIIWMKKELKFDGQNSLKVNQLIENVIMDKRFLKAQKMYEQYFNKLYKNEKDAQSFLYNNDNKSFNLLSFWFLTTEYLNNLNYQNYNYQFNNLYFSELNELKEKFGIFGLSQRILRENTLLKQLNIDKLFNKVDKYNRLILMFTIASGFDFANIFSRFNFLDIDLEVINFTSQYPIIDKKIEYYSISAIKKLYQNLKIFDKKTNIKINFTNEINNENQIEISSTFEKQEYQNSAIAYELYVDNELKYYSTKNQFIINKKNLLNKHIFVKAYDYQLNESAISNILFIK
ncbi:hypothetical protein [Mesomycoplasma lagogenitalium]|uniref:Lipoprotein n=1 Tax=Mesomycoplasma lagogenitalium TaxID=171286 RepID=A0ABY8LUF2_9BACT|nr:hypothetical protein [Mesomycoplasma lagogenitalium]WGI36861.1 hypothetical protein QEG99_01080 [Mesomycoplasma lagogenitalium]